MSANDSGTAHSGSGEPHDVLYAAMRAVILDAKLAVGDKVAIRFPGREMPKWCSRSWVRDQDRCIVLWLYNFFGRPIGQRVTIFVVTSK